MLPNNEKDSNPPAYTTNVWSWMETQNLSATHHIHRALALAAILRRSLCDETPIPYGTDAHYMEVCCELIMDELEASADWLEGHLNTVPYSVIPSQPQAVKN